ncbi:MAG TPA: ABC transporter permease [Acetobacteraceae bacterium]|jgi:lipopolysaccharide transport system permease protein|nr:ABC transporter permease [Acetobacteraceae bacterium]
MSAAAQEYRRADARNVVLDLRGDRSRAALRGLAVRDVVDGLRLWRLAVRLGWLDIKLRYRGSMLGPFWLTISTAVMVTALGVLFATLYHMDVRDYLPFLALSQVLWGFLSTLVSDGCSCFTSSEPLILSIRMPLSVHALRVLVRGLLILAHNVVVIVGVDLWFSLWPGTVLLLAIPGMLLWMVDAFALCLILGAIGARFRDIPPIVASIVQIAFFVTPVIWKPVQLGARAWILPYNPFFDLIEVVRAPLLGYLPSTMTWLMAVAYSVLLLFVTWRLMVRARGRVPFWL